MKDFLINRKRRVTGTAFMFLISIIAVYMNDYFILQGEGIRVIYLLGILMLAAACEYMDASLGMGFGTSLTPLLLLAGFSPLDVIPSILASQLVTGGFATFMHYKDGNIAVKSDKRLMVLIAGLVVLSFAGALSAVIFSFKISTLVWKYMIIAIICSMGILILFYRSKDTGLKPFRMLAIGLIASFNKGMSGGGYGPLMTAGQVTSGVSSRNAVAITTFTEFFTSGVAFTAFVAGGAKLNYSLMIPLVFGAVCAVPFATLTVKQVSEAKLKKMIGVLTISLGLLIILKTLL